MFLNFKKLNRILLVFLNFLIGTKTKRHQVDPRAVNSECPLLYLIAPTTAGPKIYMSSLSKVTKGRLNRIPISGVGNAVMATVKKGKPELQKKGIAFFGNVVRRPYH